jgi:hypothetical protein
MLSPNWERDYTILVVYLGCSVTPSLGLACPHKERNAMVDHYTSPHHPEHNEALSPGHAIYSEILSVTSVMRKNSRWSSSMQTFYTKDSALASNLGLRRPGPNSVLTPQQGSREEDLMSGFEELKRALRTAQGTCPVFDVFARLLKDILF